MRERSSGPTASTSRRNRFTSRPGPIHSLPRDTPGLAVGAGDPHRARDARAAKAAIPVRILIARKVLLVVVLGEVELGRRLDLGGDLAVSGLAQLLLEGDQRLFGGGALLVGVVEDCRTILRAD